MYSLDIRYDHPNSAINQVLLNLRNNASKVSPNFLDDYFLQGPGDNYYFEFPKFVARGANITPDQVADMSVMFADNNGIIILKYDELLFLRVTKIGESIRVYNRSFLFSDLLIIFIRTYAV